MESNTTAAREIRARVLELASEEGHDASALRDDEVIPQTGWLDSGALIALIAWFEDRFECEIEPEEFTLENFGTVRDMARTAARLGQV